MIKRIIKEISVDLWLGARKQPPGRRIARGIIIRDMARVTRFEGILYSDLVEFVKNLVTLLLKPILGFSVKTV